ncbi:DUF1127 domain-containing protein [Pelagibius sp. 7325]|uniref:DUF1127 domain-containing protein n=1 Tax=Pelagibius sp. 7325 TaxID=3131994 RepID=UPI0030EF31D3
MAIAQTPVDPRQAAPADPHRAAPASPPSGGLRGLAGLKAAWATWRKRRAYRRDLKRLLQAGPHLISDIGLAREAAHREVGKAFWED